VIDIFGAFAGFAIASFWHPRCGFLAIVARRREA
jgi:hypothetical protein